MGPATVVDRIHMHAHLIMLQGRVRGGKLEDACGISLLPATDGLPLAIRAAARDHHDKMPQLLTRMQPLTTPHVKALVPMHVRQALTCIHVSHPPWHVTIRDTTHAWII